MSRRKSSEGLVWTSLVESLTQLACIAICLMTAAPRLQAQPSTGSVNGTVRDPTGSPVAGADLVLTNVDTGVLRRTMSNTSGVYAILNLVPGEYTLQANQKGFRTTTTERFRLAVNQTATMDFALELGALTETITVRAIGDAVQSATAELGVVIAQRQVEDLPLNGRNFTQLLTLGPGTSPANPSASAGSIMSGARVGQVSYPSFNGQTNRSNFFMLDGVFNTSSVLTTASLDPIIDTIQEFKVQTHNDQAEFGQALGGIVNVVTKSGANELHGAAWEFIRNNALNARNFFLPKVTPLKENQFGVTVGGPVQKNRLFYHVAYQGYRYRSPSQTLLRVPTDAELAGDLRSIPRAIYNPFTTREDPARPGTFIRDPFPNNQIPANLIHPGMVHFAKTLLPRPISTGIEDRNGIDSTPIHRDQEEFSARGDYNLRTNDSIFFRWSEARLDQTRSQGIPSLLNAYSFRARNIAASWVHTLSASSVLHVQLGRATNDGNTKDRYSSALVPDPKAFAQQVGYGAGYCCNFDPGLSNEGVLIPGLGATGFWTNLGETTNTGRWTDVWQYKANYSHIAGRHTLKFGGELSSIPYFGGVNLELRSTYSAAQTADPTNPGPTGSPLASFLMNVADRGAFSNTSTSTRWGGVMGLFVQDGWKITPKLTMNIGLRYDRTFVPPLGRENDPTGNIFVGSLDLNRGVFLLQKVPPSCAVAGKAPCIPTPDGSLPAHVEVEPRGKIYHDYTDQWQPRLGIAYRIAPRTAIRTSFGIFFDSWAGVVQGAQNFSGSWPTVGDVRLTGLNTPIRSQPTPSVSGLAPIQNTVLPGATPFLQGGSFIDPFYKAPYSLQYNFGVQHQLTGSTVLSVNYVGSGSRRTSVGAYHNTAMTPGPGNNESRRPFPYITPLFYSKSIGRSSYNALQTTLERRFSNGLTFMTAYTWSKVISLGCDGWAGEGCSIQDIYHLENDRSVGAIDIPHNLMVNWTYELPFGRGKRFRTNNMVVDHVFGDWQINGIASFYSGTPYSVGLASDIANTGNATGVRLNLIGDPRLSDPTPSRWFNKEAFAVPAAFTFGNSGRNILRTDGTSNFDLSVFRSFPIPLRESMRLTFRAEFFNAFNSPVFARPGIDPTVPLFGVVTSTANRERIVQLALKLMF